MASFAARTKPKRKHLSLPVVGAIVLVIIIASFCGLLLAGKLPWQPAKSTPKPQPTTNNSVTKGEGTNTTPSADNSAPGAAKNDQTTPTNNGVLLAPIGTFVSSHHPHLSNNPDGSAYLTSVCTTTPGATCQIVFTMNGTTVSLPAETTDAGGSAYWNHWKLQDYNLTEGTWHIQAIATLGSQTKTADDALSLEVTQ